MFCDGSIMIYTANVFPLRAVSTIFEKVQICPFIFGRIDAISVLAVSIFVHAFPVSLDGQLYLSSGPLISDL